MTEEETRDSRRRAIGNYSLIRISEGLKGGDGVVIDVHHGEGTIDYTIKGMRFIIHVEVEPILDGNGTN